MMLNGSNGVCSIAQLTLKLLLQRWELGAACKSYFLKLRIFVFDPPLAPLKENLRHGTVFLCVRVCRFVYLFAYFSIF